MPSSFNNEREFWRDDTYKRYEEGLKFGLSKDVDYRISCYGLTNCEAEVLKIVPISTGRIAIRVEKGIHKKLKQLKIDNEYTKPYFSVSGFTECYPYSALTIITKEMENCIGK